MRQRFPVISAGVIVGVVGMVGNRDVFHGFHNPVLADAWQNEAKMPGSFSRAYPGLFWRVLKCSHDVDRSESVGSRNFNLPGARAEASAGIAKMFGR
jgi:hypothetical protein